MVKLFHQKKLGGDNFWYLELIMHKDGEIKDDVADKIGVGWGK